jgi:single stranded DNA-binding protein
MAARLVAARAARIDSLHPFRLQPALDLDELRLVDSDQHFPLHRGFPIHSHLLPPFRKSARRSQVAACHRLGSGGKLYRRKKPEWKKTKVSRRDPFHAAGVGPPMIDHRPARKVTDKNCKPSLTAGRDGRAPPETDPGTHPLRQSPFGFPMSLDGAKDIRNPKGDREMRFAMLVGNVGNKPEVQTSNSTTYCNLSIAVNERFKHREPVTEWYDVVAFGKLAETLVHVETGDELLVVGTFHQVSYTGKDQVRHRKIEIRAWEIKFLRRRDRGQAEEPEPADAGDPAALAAAAVLGGAAAAGLADDAGAGTPAGPATRPRRKGGTA